MPLLRPSPSDYTTVVKALANAGAAVSNPQGSRPASKGSVAFVNVSTVAALIRGSPRLASILPRVAAALPSLVPTPVAPVDPNYTVYQTSLFVSINFWGGAFARDTSGNLYGRIVTQNFNLYKVAPNGTQTFLAGNGVTGNFIPGVGAAVQFDSSFGVNGFVIDSLGNLFTCSASHRVIKIEPNGNVTSFAGTGTDGYNDGPTATATFSSPRGIAIDASNTLYVWEFNRKAIRKITSSGQVSTLTFSAAFNPAFYGIAVDSTGVIYATDAISDRVYKITPTGPTTADIALLAGSTVGYTNGQGSAAQFNFDSSSGLCVDAFGNVYVGDGGNGSVRKITPGGLVSTIAGNGTNAGSNSNTQLYSPSKPSIDATGVIYIGLGDVRKISPVIASLANVGSDDAFVVKYDSAGTLLWARRIGGILSEEELISVNTDSAGNIVVTGPYNSNPVTIYNADGSNAFTLTNSGSSDGFVVKYNSAGTPLWALRFGGAGIDGSESITFDSSGNIIVAATHVSDPFTIYDTSGSAVTSLTKINTGGTDGLVIKYDSNGTFLWSRRLSGSNTATDNRYMGIATDLSGNIIISISSSASGIVYDQSGNVVANITNGGRYVCMVVKYNSSGTMQWVRRIDGDGWEYVYSISTDLNGNIVVVGNNDSGQVINVYNQSGTIFTSFNSVGIYNSYVIKYSSSGIPLWASLIAGTGSHTTLAKSVSVDSDGNAIVVGHYSGSNPLTIYDVNQAPTSITLTNSGRNDGFVVKYDSAGTPLWARRLGGSSDDRAFSVSTDSSGNIVVAGQYYSNPLTIFAADGSNAFTLTNSGNNEAFVVKYNSAGTPQWARRLGETGNDQARSITADSSGNIVVAGQYASNPLNIT